MSQAARKSIILNFECTSLFPSWWEDKWTKKYGGDLRETHDRLFSQLSLKSYPSSGELENWKEIIQEKNRILLIAQVDVESVPTESEDDSADTAVLHGAAAEAERREAGKGRDVSEDSGAQKEAPEATIQVSKRRKAVVIENSDSDPASPPKTKRRISTPTRKSKRTRTIQTLKSSDPPTPISEACRKKQKSSRPQASKKPTIASKDEPLGAEMYKKAEELLQERTSSIRSRALHHLPEKQTSLPPRLNPSEVGVSAPSPSQGSPLISPSVLKATPSSQFDPSTGVMLHFMDEDSNLVFAYPTVTLDEPHSSPQG
ncbi:uncharacterized protein [Malus domestica]|uniref:uncharacterized protein n=1 Tax=Malus domestica TaxID=3750 RepID=UPI0039751B09